MGVSDAVVSIGEPNVESLSREAPSPPPPSLPPFPPPPSPPPSPPPFPPPSPPPPSPPPPSPPPPSFPFICPMALTLPGHPSGTVPLDSLDSTMTDPKWCYAFNGDQDTCESKMIYLNATDDMAAGYKGSEDSSFRRCLYGLVEPGKCTMSEVQERCLAQPSPPPPSPPNMAPLPPPPSPPPPSPPPPSPPPSPPPQPPPSPPPQPPLSTATTARSAAAKASGSSPGASTATTARS